MNKIGTRRYQSVREWWRQRLLAGSQVSDWSRFVVHFDYRGDGNWKSTVRSEVLYADYSLFEHAVEMTLDQFIGYFFLFNAGVGRTKIKRGRMNKDNGERFVQKRHRHIVFKTIQEHQAHLDMAL